MSGSDVVLSAEPLGDCPRPIGYALWHLEQARQWTLSYVDGVTPEVLDFIPAGHPYSIATLLYHITVFEVDWLYTDLLGSAYDMKRRIPGCPPHISDVLPYPLLLEDMSYTPVSGEALETHLDRMATVRVDLIETFREMTVEDFRRPRPGEESSVTPEWVLMHLARHESEHRGQIWVARTAAEKEVGNDA